MNLMEDNGNETGLLTTHLSDGLRCGVQRESRRREPV